MRLLIVVNEPDTEHRRDTSTVLGEAACRRGHEVWVAGVGDLDYQEDGRVGARARRAPGEDTGGREGYLSVIQGKDATRETVTTAELDVIWLRFNPGQEPGLDPRVEEAGILFGQLALEQGVLVLNHPYSLSWVTSKMYFEQFPSAVRPLTVITRDPDRVAAFHQEHGPKIVVKPLMGYGGSDVFMIGEDGSNLTQIVESIARTGYVIAQTFLPGADEGDTRVIMVNGKPLVVDGKHAALRRLPTDDDFRSNMSAGGRAEPPEITDTILRLAGIVGPKLIKDGVFFAGLDVVGEKLVEINTISAGGLNAAAQIQERDFGSAVIEAVERKVFYRRHHGDHIRNIDLATLD